VRQINPASIVTPASNYVQGVVHKAGGERVVVSGQLGLKPDGTLESGLEAQMERAWSNVFAVLEDAGFEKRHLVACRVYVTEPGRIAIYRAVRDRMLAGHKCANTYLQISGLAAPEFLVEIEAEAVRE
jgi:enamine deaminase RidA (YjgF/YER057c/UK114 family)